MLTSSSSLFPPPLPLSPQSIYYNHSMGVSCVGAVPLILNLNMKVKSDSGAGDASTMKQRKSQVSQITKFVREPGVVESLTLAHDEGLLVDATFFLYATSYFPYMCFLVVGSFLSLR